MSLIQKNINGLYKGVSTQEETNQLEGQVRQSVNMLHSVEKGVSRRNPAEIVKRFEFYNVDANNLFVHNYARGDGLEEYIFLIGNGSLRVFDMEGNAKVVNYLNDTQTALSTNLPPYKSFKCLTVGDTTFITNLDRIVETVNYTDGVPDSHLLHPFYWLKRSFDNGGGQGYDYTLDGVTVNATKTSEACTKLLTALGTTNYKQYGSILLRKNKPVDFIWSDSFGSTASEGFWGVAQKIEDLPNTMSGAELDYDIVIEVKGNPDNKFSTYWLKYENGHWKETRKLGMVNTLDNTTMPFKITRNELGEFDVDYIEYYSREVGDEDTAPMPSFVGKNIADLFFFKNRLCFLSGENVIMSETGAYYNFFPTTVTDVLSSDPIDVSVDTNSVAILRYAIPYNDSLLLFSDNAQFTLKASEVLSPNEVSITTSTRYNIDNTVMPVSMGNSVFFMSDTLKGSILQEYFLDSNGTSNVAVNVSNHVDGYIPNDIVTMVGSIDKNMVILLPKNDRKSLYLYKYYNSDNDRIQSAWFKWTFNSDVVNMFISNDYLYLVKRDNLDYYKLILERIDCTNNTNVISFIDYGDTQYASYVELPEAILLDRNNKIISNIRSPLIYKTLQLTSSNRSKYQIKVVHKTGERVAKNVSVSDNKILVQGKAKDINLFIESVGSEPLEFHTYSLELNYNSRAKLI